MGLSPLATAPLLAFLCCLALHAASLWVFPRLGLLDFPERYGLRRKRLPYPTGILCAVIFLVFFAFLKPWNMQNIGLFSGSILLIVVSFCDDRLRLSPAVRLITQAVVAILIFVTGTRIYTLTDPVAVLGFPAVIKLDTWNIILPAVGSVPVWSGVFTLLWLMVTTNALNWFDGIAGQVSALSTIGFATIGFLSLSARVDQPGLAVLAFILTGICAASLLFNFPPPLVILGDSGAMFFGLMLGVFTIYAGGKVATGFLVFGVPLLDFVIVILRRLIKRKSPFAGNMTDEHLHHRLLNIGWSPARIIIVTSTMGLLFGVAALFMTTGEKFLAAIVLFLVMLFLSEKSKPKKAHQ